MPDPSPTSPEPDPPPAPKASQPGPTLPSGASPVGNESARSPSTLGLSPGDRVGPYTLREVIGEGGFGVVWLAERREPMVQRVALKIIKPGMDSASVVARFDQERQALAVMDHPNVAKVFDGGVTDRGLPYFVMEHVKGEPITVFADRHRLTIRQRLELFLPVCEAVQHAHMKGIIHRDIKPSNILVSPGHEGGAPIVKVIDFGVAKAISHTLTDRTIFTEQGQIIGTPEYMSPEQAEMGATDIDTRTDVYSLGVVLYELLSGTLPFDARTLRSAGYAEVQRIIREVEAPRPSTKLSTADDQIGATIAKARQAEREKIAGELRRELEWIPLKALRKDRTRRYASSESLGADVRRYLDGKPLEAAPESRGYLLRKFVRRNSVQVAAVGAVALALMVGFGTALWQTNLARIEATRARQAEAEQRASAAAEARAREEMSAERTRAEAAARSAELSASVTDARYALSRGSLPEAFRHASRASALSDGLDQGLLNYQVFKAARERWSPVARLRLPGRPSSAAFVPPSTLVLAELGGVRAFDAISGEHKASVRLPEAVTGFIADSGGSGGDVIAQTRDGLIRMDSATLQVLARVAIPDMTFAAGSDGGVVALDRQGTVIVLDRPTLTDRARRMFRELTPDPDTRNQPVQADISPDGSLVAVHERPWWRPLVLWRWADADGKNVTSLAARVSRLAFADDRSLVTWFQPEAGNSSYPDDVQVWDLTKPEPAVAPIYGITAGTTGVARWLQARRAGPGSPIVTLIGQSGILTLQPSRAQGHAGLRLANLEPQERSAPHLLACRESLGLLAVRRDSEVTIYAASPPSGQLDVSDFCAVVAGDVLLRVNAQGLRPTLITHPLSRIGSSTSQPLDWPMDRPWYPWALAVTPDGLTVAVLMQESEALNRIGDRLGQTRVRLYRRSSPASAATPLQPIAEVTLDVPSPQAPWQPRLLGLSPDASSVTYWTSWTGQAHRFSLPAGTPMGASFFGDSAAADPTNRRMAGLDSSRGVLRLLDLESGTVTPLREGLNARGQPAFSADGGHVAVASGHAGGDLVIDVLRVPDGSSVLRLSSPLEPIAMQTLNESQPGATQMVATRRTEGQPESDTVVADLAGSPPKVVLATGVPLRGWAAFSREGTTIVSQTSRWLLSIDRAISPADLSKALAADHISPAPAEGLPPLLSRPPPSATSALTSARPDDAIDVRDLPKLNEQIGREVSVFGRVSRIVPTRTGDAINVEFEGPEATRLMLWVDRISLPNMDAAFNGNATAALDGRMLRVRGVVTPYGGRSPSWKSRLQITITDPSQVSVLEEPSPQPENSPRR